MMSQETKQPLTKFDILRATENYLSMCSDKSNNSCEWGDGDSLDRERVRDILLYDYNYKFVGEYDESKRTNQSIVILSWR